MTVIIHNKAQIDTLAAALDTAAGLPREGVDTPGSLAPPHNLVTGVGYSLHLAARRVLGNGQHAIVVDAAVQAHIDAGDVTLPPGNQKRAWTPADDPAPTHL